MLVLRNACQNHTRFLERHAHLRLGLGASGARTPASVIADAIVSGGELVGSPLVFSRVGSGGFSRSSRMPARSGRGRSAAPRLDRHRECAGSLSPYLPSSARSLAWSS